MPKIPSSISTGEPTGVGLAVNLADLSRLPPAILSALLREKLDRRKESLVWVDRERPDETGVPLVGDLLAGASALDLVRGHDRKAGDYPTRCYVRKGRTWTKLPASAVLVLVAGGKPCLNPEVFGGSIESEVPAFAPVKLGRKV